MAEAQKAFITGASRGIGAKTAEALAHRGWDVAIGYQSRQKYADKVVDIVRDIGREAFAVGGDITDPKSRYRIITEVSEWAPKMGGLVLNAAGGMEPDRKEDPDYPLAINRDAQVALVEGFIPVLRGGGNIVYLQSYVGSLHGKIEPPSELYSQRVAGPKNAGEKALRAMIPDLARDYIRLAVVTGGIVEDTTVGKLSLRDERIAKAQKNIGNVVTAADMAERIAEIIVNQNYVSGHTEVVGAPLQKHLEERG